MKYTIFDTPILRTALRFLSIGALKVTGWRRDGEPPDLKKFVVIAAPHTTNWELPIALLLAFSFRVKVCWMGKDSLFRGPLGPFFKFLGGIPVDRSKSTGMVQQTIDAFREREEMILVLAPEGTRSHSSHWRSGFYHIANGASVPIVLGFMDFAHKTAGVGPIVKPTGDIEEDMKEIRRFYSGVMGKYPEKASSTSFSEDFS